MRSLEPVALLLPLLLGARFPLVVRALLERVDRAIVAWGQTAKVRIDSPGLFFRIWLLASYDNSALLSRTLFSPD